MEQQFAQAYYLFQQGAFVESAQICVEILSRKPKHVHANHLLGLCRYQQGDYARALPCLERAVGLDPSDPDAQSNLAMTLGRVGRPKDAEAHARRAVELNPGAAAPLAVLGKVLVELRSLPEATAVLERAMAMDRNNPDVLGAYGELCRIQRRLPEAKQIYEQALALAPNSALMLNDLGLISKELMDYDGAQACFEKARKLAPQDPDILINLGNLAAAGGEVEAARDFFGQALTLNDRYPLAYVRLFELAGRHGDMNQATYWLKRGIAACPEDSALHEQLAVVYAQRQDFSRAYGEIEQAVSIGGETASTELVRAEIYDCHHNHEGAAAAFHRALEFDPYNPELLLKFADFEEQRNRYDDAAKLAMQAFALDPSREAEARVLVARADRRRRDYEGAAAEIARINFPTLPIGLQTRAWYELGNLRDAQGEYAAAFDAFSKGAQAAVRAGDLYFDLSTTLAKLRHVREVLSPDVLKNLARFIGDLAGKSTPVFIVGFMRSGTTLTEQILSSHPAVQAGDELTALPALTQGIGKDLDAAYPECLAAIDPDRVQDLLAQWRGRYLERVRNFGLDVDRGGFFTDKLPLNLLELPLISMVFPEAPILHIRRNPLDCVFSNFVSNFGPISPWAYDLEQAAAYYKGVMELGDYYKESLPMRYHELRYEDLVATPEPMIREMAEFVGLPWDDSMLSFYENKRVARTPSHAQVNQPMYTRSVERYRNYEEFLTKPLAILEPLMRRYGYLGGGN